MNNKNRFFLDGMLGFIQTSQFTHKETKTRFIEKFAYSHKGIDSRDQGNENTKL